MNVCACVLSVCSHFLSHVCMCVCVFVCVCVIWCAVVGVSLWNTASVVTACLRGVLLLE